jgi:PKD repeat protein
LLKYVPNTTSFDNAVSADFDFVIEKQNVFFTDRSVNGQFYHWNLGDGEISDQVNPTHQYALPGSYLVRLDVSGSCDGQTVEKRVDVRGIYKITPTVGPDRGFTLCHVFGYGFDATSQVILKKDATIIVANQVFFDTATQTLQANFHFANAPTGLYDLMVTTGSHTDTLPHGFEIQPIDVGTPWVQLVGPYNRFFRSLTGERVNTFRLEYGVTGNATQYMIPLGVIISGNELTANMLTPVINRGDTTNLPDSMKPHSSGFSRMYDETTGDSIWRFLALDYVVEANMTHVLEFTAVSTTIEGEYGIRGYIGNSQFDSEQLDTIYSRGTSASSNICNNNCISCLLNAAGAVPGPIGCMASVVSIGCTISNLITTPQSTLTGVINVAISIGGAAVACLTMTGNSSTQFLQAYQQALLGIITKSSGGLLQNCAQALVNILISGTCNGPAGQTGGKFRRRGSFDPNIKTGPASYNTNHYINKKIPLIYQVEFENLATATAPAFMVFVTDTLDKSVIDVSTLHFTGVNIANVNYPIFKTKDSFALDIPMPAKGINVRVNGKLDTATGIIRWEFLSLDTLTMKLVDDQDKGFLPPNVDSISGKAFVSFTVEQKSSNTHLTNISNKAKIVFDVNAPIFTPVYTNIVDTVKPQSHILNQFRIINDSTFSIKWTGTDAHAGIRDYKIFMSDNDSVYNILGIYGRDSTVVKGTMGRVYKFISIATDSVNNIEEPPANALNNPDAIFIFNAALPIKLLSFTAIKENETGLLKWSASSEINSSHFVIEHSRNGITYSALATVRAAGNSSSQTDYSYKHSQPSKGFNYYRLKIVDKDGKFEYSPVRRLQFDKVDAMTVSPNPAINRVYINITEPGGILRLISSTGKVMKEIEMVGNNADIDIAALAQGVYFIIYNAPDNKRWSEKLLIQRGF